MNTRKRARMLALVMIAALILFTGTFDGQTTLAKGSAYPPGDVQGSLIIAGGGMGAASADVTRKFIELAGGVNARFGFVAAATGSLSSARSFREELQGYGVKPENIFILPVSKHDFSDATAAENAALRGKENSEDAAKLIRSMNAIWFLGGDQMWIVQALRNKDGSNSKALDAIWDAYRNGAVLAGSSAGAAIMSGQMIANGDCVGAITKGTTVITNFDNDENYADHVVVTKGLGFFRWGMTDQHYDKRSRLGRTVIASLDAGDGKKWAFGVDENTAMIVDSKRQNFTVLGKGYVTCVDMRNTTRKGSAPTVEVRNVRFGLLDKGDTFDLNKMVAIVSPEKDKETTPEKYDSYVALNTGAFSAYNKLKEFIFNLMGGDSKEYKSYCFDENGNGCEMVFSRDKDTSAWCGTREELADWAVMNVRLDILPVRVKIDHLDAR